MNTLFGITLILHFAETMLKLSAGKGFCIYCIVNNFFKKASLAKSRGFHDEQTIQDNETIKLLGN